MTDLFIKYMRTILVIINQFFVIDNSVFEHFEHSEDSNSYQGSIFDFFSHFFLNKDKNKYMEKIMYYGAVHILYTNSFFGIVIHWNA